MVVFTGARRGENAGGDLGRIDLPRVPFPPPSVVPFDPKIWDANPSTFYSAMSNVDVEIGAGTTVDRGAHRDTMIGEGTKIDNLVQIAHNVSIGRHCIIVAFTGISGSCTLGDHVVLGANVGLVDHITIGDGAQLAARSGVMHDVPAGEVWGGAPAMSAATT